MEPYITDSARKHGISDEDILHAFNHPLFVIPDPDDSDLTMLVGPDIAANLVEIGIVDSDEGPVIVHALRPARRRYLPR